MPATHCTGCGRPLAAGAGQRRSTGGVGGPGADGPGSVAGDPGSRWPDTGQCPGCARPIDPPRYCPACGRWLAVAVSPTGWRARCRDHGDVGPDSPAG